jgi:hypothetical protein
MCGSKRVIHCFVCVTLCNAYTFRKKVDFERNEREKNLLEKIQKTVCNSTY